MIHDANMHRKSLSFLEKCQLKAAPSLGEVPEARLSSQLTTP